MPKCLKPNYRISFFKIIAPLTVIISLFITSNLSAQTKQYFNFTKSDTLWVDSVYNSLTLQERIAQLIMIKAFSDRDKKYNDEISRIIKEYNVGGLCFFQGGPIRQANLTNYWQSISKTPFMVAIDGEWGLSMRLDSTISFPRAMALGAIGNDSLIYEMGVEIGRQCKRMGININFAPVIDINNNPQNPVINIRSFGEYKNNVTNKGIAYMRGMQDNGILASAKHFPGHGDTDTDSHYSLPVIKHSAEMIDSIDLFPFKKLINDNIGSVMVAHLYVPALDTIKSTPSTLSKLIVTDLLKKKLNFNGLIFTDALEMKGVASYFKPGEIEVKALLAGNDVLLLPQDVEVAIKQIKLAVDTCIIWPEVIEEKCKKVLFYKKWMGLDKFQKIKTKHLASDLYTLKAELLQRKLIDASITIIKNDKNILPLKNLDTLKLASLSIGDTVIKTFQNVLNNYANIDFFNILKTYTRADADSMLKKLSKYNLIVVGIHNTNSLANRNFGITQQTIDFIDSLRKGRKIILNLFGNPYALGRFKDLNNLVAIVVTYQDNRIIEHTTAQILFGAKTVNSKLPISATAQLPVFTGINTYKVNRLEYVLPEIINIHTKDLDKVDTIAMKGIHKKAYPGCQVMAAKDGKVFYQKSFGYHTYDDKQPVKTNDIYDLASVTKVASVTLSVMKLYDEKKIDINQTLDYYLPMLKGTNKEGIILKDVLAHQARLKPWIPYYKRTLVNGKPDTNIYKKVQSENYPIKVADSLFIRKDYQDTIFRLIIESPVKKKKEYIYSDLGFYLLMKIIEKVTNQSLDKYVENSFYKPMGLSTATYNPSEKFDNSRIPPTENDTTFRKQIVQGYVNDQGAAMLGGISGHAGLFSNCNDMAILCQMLLQNGEYGGIRYISDTTVKLFTKCQFPELNNRRGLGFDKPLLKGRRGGPSCHSASPNSYGHTGFTGTYIWVDPDENLVYIFLSNRTYPTPTNSLILDMNIRTDIQQVFYDEIAKSKKVKQIVN